ncbi:MAG: YigZ family protein [Tissierellia bacterium]|nr:YigZ family protein [Tissierellia bacterium]
MKTITKSYQSERVIQKSRFLSYLEPMTSLEEMEQRHKELRKIHRKANHVCYAYRFGMAQPVGHFSDDGEPSQTAGLPMYQVLEGEDMTDVAVYVVRYFGGIKLGTGGLVRAYSQAVKDVIEQAAFQDIYRRYKLELNYSYSYHNQVQNLLTDVASREPIYREDIHWTVYLEDEQLIEQLIDLTEGSIKIKQYGQVFIASDKRGTLELGGHDETID